VKVTHGTDNTMWRRKSVIIIIIVMLMLSLSVTSNDDDDIDGVAGKYEGRCIPELCGFKAPEWMRESRLCDRVVEDEVSAEYGHLGAALQTAKNANLYRMIWSAGSAIASASLAGAGMVACVGSCGQLCPGPTSLVGLSGVAVASASDAINAFTHCEDCEKIEEQKHELESRNHKVFGEMSEEAKKEANEMFDAFDEDENGIVTAHEISLAIEDVGDNPDPKEIDAMITSSDMNGDGVLDRLEFMKSMYKAGLDGEELIY
jgi:hypothetical protein